MIDTNRQVFALFKEGIGDSDELQFVTSRTTQHDLLEAAAKLGAKVENVDESRDWRKLELGFDGPFKLVMRQMAPRELAVFGY